MSQLTLLPKPGTTGKLICLYGTSEVFRASLYAASQALLKGIPITVVDGANRLDVYYIAEFARRIAGQGRNVTPGQLLERIYVARAFTCYQMEATITERLPVFLQRKHGSVAIVFGLLDTFYDEQAPFFEVSASLERIIAALYSLKQHHVSILLASVEMKLASKERNTLFPRVLAAMDETHRIGENQLPDGESQRTIIQGGKYGPHRADIYDGYPGGNRLVGKIPKRIAQGRSGRHG